MLFKYINFNQLSRVLFSFFKRDSFTRNFILSHPEMELFTPVYVFEELDEHRDEVKSKSRINDKIFELFIYHPLASKI